MHSKNKTSLMGNSNEMPERSSATKSLRGASTTIGRAGEQIMGAALSSKKQSSKADPRQASGPHSFGAIGNVNQFKNNINNSLVINPNAKNNNQNSLYEQTFP